MTREQFKELFFKQITTSEENPSDRTLLGYDFDVDAIIQHIDSLEQEVQEWKKSVQVLSEHACSLQELIDTKKQREAGRIASLREYYNSFGICLNILEADEFPSDGIDD